MARVNKNTKPQYHHLPVAMIDTPVDKENTRERSRGLTVESRLYPAFQRNNLILVDDRMALVLRYRILIFNVFNLKIKISLVTRVPGSRPGGFRCCVIAVGHPTRALFLVRQFHAEAPFLDRVITLEQNRFYMP